MFNFHKSTVSLTRRCSQIVLTSKLLFKYIHKTNLMLSTGNYEQLFRDECDDKKNGDFFLSQLSSYAEKI